MYPRIAGQLGNYIKLNMKFYKNRTLTDPYSINYIKIYKNGINKNNLIHTIAIDQTGDQNLIKNDVGDYEYHLLLSEDLFDCYNIYFDVWEFTTAVQTNETTISQNGMFLAYDEIWIADDELSTRRLNLNPLDKKFKRGEIRPLELSIHPLPLYEHDYNKIIPIIPNLNPTISIYTSYDELVIKDDDCLIGLKQGSNRNSPFVVKYLLDTRQLLIGTYKYKIKMTINNQTIISQQFNFTVQ